jgi:hypothetical protein
LKALVWPLWSGWSGLVFSSPVLHAARVISCLLATVSCPGSLVSYSLMSCPIFKTSMHAGQRRRVDAWGGRASLYPYLEGATGEPQKPWARETTPVGVLPSYISWGGGGGSATCCQLQLRKYSICTQPYVTTEILNGEPGQSSVVHLPSLRGAACTDVVGKDALGKPGKKWLRCTGWGFTENPRT